MELIVKIITSNNNMTELIRVITVEYIKYVLFWFFSPVIRSYFILQDKLLTVSPNDDLRVHLNKLYHNRLSVLITSIEKKKKSLIFD